jgi:hypothetical protein
MWNARNRQQHLKHFINSLQLFSGERRATPSQLDELARKLQYGSAWFKNGSLQVPVISQEMSAISDCGFF